MKTAFPVRKQNGSQYSTPEELMALTGREPHGSWLGGTSPLRENRIKGAYAWLSERTGKERGMRERQVSAFYKNLVRRMDSDGNGELSGRELYNALYYTEPGLRDIAARLVVKHDSEWYGGSGHHRWNVYFSHYDNLRIAYAKQWLDDCEWMSKVEAFKDGKPVWPFYPVMFLAALHDPGELINIDDSLQEYEKKHSSFATGTPELSQKSRDNLKKQLVNINEYYSVFAKYQPNLYKISCMLATYKA